MNRAIACGFLYLFAAAGSVWAQTGDHAQHDTYYFNEGEEDFFNVPETEESVDSLLNASWESRNTNLEKAMQKARLGLTLAKRLGYKKGTARSHQILGLTNQRVGAHEQALDHYFTVLDMQRSLGDTVQVGKTLNGIGLLYYRQGKYNSAIKYLEQSHDLMQEIDHKDRQAIAMANLGLVYFERGEYDKSLIYYNWALETFRGETDNDFGTYVTLSNIGDTNLELENYEKAKKYLFEASDYFETEGLVRNQSEVYLSISKLYHQLDGKNDAALEYANRSLEKAESISYKKSLIAAYKQLATIYEDQNSHKRALRLYKKFKTVKDSLLNSERMAKIEEMQMRFDVEQKNREIELLNKEAALQETQLDRQKLWRMFMIIGIGLLAVIVGLLYRYNNQKKRANYLLEEKNSEIEQQNNKLVRLNEEKNEFMGMAAHDLRNPLSGINSVVSLIQDDDDISEDELDEYLNIVGHSSDRMLNLINNLLDVNAIEEGGRDLELTAVETAELVEITAAAEKRHAADKKIDLQVQLDKDLPPVLADREALQRVLENLVSNAVKYSPEGATVEVKAQAQDGLVELSVIDNGPGIPNDEQDQLFQRFSRISTTPTADESSTGLGLFIVKELVEKMDGHVRCESTEGEGTAFIAKLPTGKN